MPMQLVIAWPPGPSDRFQRGMGCPQCGRYLVRYPDTEVVRADGAPGPPTSSAPSTTLTRPTS
jgi:hypothetical protein